MLNFKKTVMYDENEEVSKVVIDVIGNCNSDRGRLTVGQIVSTKGEKATFRPAMSSEKGLSIAKTILHRLTAEDLDQIIEKARSLEGKGDETPQD